MTPALHVPTPSATRGLVGRPWIWGPVGIAAVFGLSTGAGRLAGMVDNWAEIIVIVGLVVCLGAYVVVMRRLAGRNAAELLRPHGGRELARGIGVGGLFAAGSCAVVVLLGGYEIRWTGVELVPMMTMILVITAAAAVTEELMFRGMLFQALEEVAGSWVALAGTAALFGAMHLGNDGADLWSAFAISVQAGLLLGAAFLWRRDLRFAIGVHLAWNATEMLLGIDVSGGGQPGLWTTVAHGSDLLTGGAFGLEASVVPVVISIVPTTLMLGAAHRRGHLQAVPWQTDRRADSTA